MKKEMGARNREQEVRSQKQETRPALLDEVSSHFVGRTRSKKQENLG